jgi:predicted acyl esterase
MQERRKAMKKEKKIAFLIVNCLMAVCFLVLQSPSARGIDLSGGIKTTLESPWPPPGQCPPYFTGGWHYDPKNLGYPLPQGVCAEGEWLAEGIIVERDVPVPMRDGVTLRANVYRPDKAGKFPVIMTFSSYTKAVSGWGQSHGVYPHMLSEETSFEFTDPGFWVPDDYVVVLVDPRGYGNSPGYRLGHRSGEDYYDGIEWAGTQEWSNGNVGMIGISALGNVQWYAAQLRPPHLKAIAPWEAGEAAPTPLFGGITEYGFRESVVRRGGSLPPDPNKGQYQPAQVPPSKLVLENITVPALCCVTSSDQDKHTRGTLWGYRKMSSKYKWMYSHGGRKWERFYSADAKAFQKMFFDCFLKGSDSRILETPRVRMEVRETLDKFTVRYEDEFPIPRTKYEKLYLDATNGTLNFHKVKRPGKISYDSAAADGRAEFNIKFDKDTELTGYMKLVVWVSPDDSKDMDLFVTVKKFDASGNEVLFDNCHAPRRYPVALGWMRLSKRQLDPKLSTPWNPIQSFVVEEKVNPGEIVPAEIEIIFSSTLFREGETLRLVISGKTQVKSTRYKYEDINQGRHSIYTGRGRDSYLQVPLIPEIPHRKGHAKHIN